MPLKKDFSTIWNLLQRYYLILILSILALVAGVIYGYNLPFDEQIAIQQSFLSTYQHIITSSDFIMFLKIFFYNSVASFFMITIGFSILVPFGVLFFNGEMAGVASSLLSHKIGQNAAAKILVGILPHGIFEIPMILLSTFLSVLVGLKFYFRKGILPEKKFTDVFKDVMKLYIRVIVPILFLAAFVEVYVTKGLIS